MSVCVGGGGREYGHSSSQDAHVMSVYSPDIIRLRE